MENNKMLGVLMRRKDQLLWKISIGFGKSIFLLFKQQFGFVSVIGSID
jgi:hypothetical protein